MSIFGTMKGLTVAETRPERLGKESSERGLITTYILVVDSLYTVGIEYLLNPIPPQHGTGNPTCFSSLGAVGAPPGIKH